MSTALEALLDIAIRHVLPLVVERVATSAVDGAIHTQMPPALVGSLDRGSMSLVPPRPDSETVTVASSTPGRLRFQVAGLRGNLTRAETISTALRRLPGIRTVSANPLVGSLLVHYEPDQISVAGIVAATEAVSAVSSRQSVCRRNNDRPYVPAAVR